MRVHRLIYIVSSVSILFSSMLLEKSKVNKQDSLFEKIETNKSQDDINFEFENNTKPEFLIEPKSDYLIFNDQLENLGYNRLF